MIIDYSLDIDEKADPIERSNVRQMTDDFKIKRKQICFVFLENTTEVFIIEAMNFQEFKRWLTKQGVTFGPAKGSHIKLYLGDKQSVMPIHNTDLKTGTVQGIKKQLGLKGK